MRCPALIHRGTLRSWGVLRRKMSTSQQDSSGGGLLLPGIAVAVTAPVVAFKSGLLDAKQLPPSVQEAIPDVIWRFLISPELASPSASAVPGPGDTETSTSEERTTPSSPADVEVFLKESAPVLRSLLERELAVVTAQESWLSTIIRPMTSARLAKERKAIIRELGLLAD